MSANPIKKICAKLFLSITLSRRKSLLLSFYTDKENRMGHMRMQDRGGLWDLLNYIYLHWCIFRELSYLLSHSLNQFYLSSHDIFFKDTSHSVVKLIEYCFILYNDRCIYQLSLCLRVSIATMMKYHDHKISCDGKGLFTLHCSSCLYIYKYTVLNFKQY